MTISVLTAIYQENVG